jgi:hypothetical protein
MKKGIPIIIMRPDFIYVDVGHPVDKILADIKEWVKRIKDEERNMD